MNRRLQGTDGIRRFVRPADDPSLAGLTPQEAFLRHDVITEPFLELYTWCRVRQLIENGTMKEGDPVVIAWDTRDRSGEYTGAAVSGLRKSGAAVYALGVAPTPLAPLYQRAVDASAGFMITASHNPSTYNGVKIFTRSGLKLLPGDDVALSRKVLETSWEREVAPRPMSGRLIDARKEAVHLFKAVHLLPENSRIEDGSLVADHTLVVDTANGALSDFAAEILREAGFGKVVPVNDEKENPINIRSGVADIEGMTGITSDMTEPGGRFAGYAAIETLFAEGRAVRDEARMGERIVSAAVFDGDGDRFYRIEYDPFTDTLRVLSGDEASLLQGRALRVDGSDQLFVNTVESDLMAQKAAEGLGYRTELTAVGDKWVLLTALMSQLEESLDQHTVDALRAEVGSELPSSDRIERILDEAGFDQSTAPPGRFTVGAEETGHAITPLATDFGLLFAGNGLKSCLNTYAATATLDLGSPEETFKAVTMPFSPGFKKTLYAYYVAKERWTRESATWRRLRDAAIASIAEAIPEATVEEMVRSEESDMLYLKLLVDDRHVGSMFIRNSGTEDKTGLNLRATPPFATRMDNAGESVIRELLDAMKDRMKETALAERSLLEAAATDGAPPLLADLDEESYHHLLMEVGVKQGFLTAPSPGATLTDRGRWALTHLYG